MAEEIKDTLPELNDKQQAFCEEYMVDLNATQAAIRSGYSINTAGAIGAENLKKPQILLRIKALMDERSRITMVDATFVVEGFKEVFERCMQKRPVMVWDYEERVMVQKKEEGENGQDQGVWEFDSQGANKALEMLGKHLAMFTDKTKLDGKQDVTITVKRGDRHGKGNNTEYTPPGAEQG